MNSARNFLPAVALRFVRCFTFAALAGCGSSSSGTGPSVITLSALDQQQGAGESAIPAAIAIGSLALSFAGRVIANEAPANVAVATLALPPTVVDRTFSCPAGGSAHTAGGVTGTLPASGTGSLPFALTTAFAACAVSGDSKTLVLTADPGLAIAGNYAVVNRTASDLQALTVKGSVTVTLANSGAPAITCAVDLTVTTSSAAHTAAVAGTFCSGSVSKQYTWVP